MEELPMPDSDDYPATTPDGRSTSFTDEPGVPAEASQVGDYELIAELAQGGMGIVYRARQRSLNRIVALKMLLSGRVTSDVGQARFRAEAEATAELDHPNIVPIFEVGVHTGRPFFSMKLIDGGTLADLLRKSPRPPLRELITALAKVCRAVHYAHQRGILHRDLKPSNVLIDTTGEPYVADFGLAKRLGSDDGLTITGALLGTPAYMAPEQAGGGIHGVTTLTDVYALGAILYEILTGRPPFATRDIDALLAQIRSDAPPLPSSLSSEIPRDMELICLKCLAKEPSERYASAGELADELERWIRGEPVRVRAPGFISRIIIWARHNSRAAMWIVVIGCAWGVFGPQLPITVTILSSILQNMAQAMSKFPSAPSHWLLRVEWSIPTVLLWFLVAVGGVLHLSVGMLTYMATRSRERLSHLGGAAAVGLIASVIAFTLYLGPASLIAAVIVPNVEDLGLLSGGFVTREPVLPREGEAPRPHAQERLLTRYPELSSVPEAERASLLFGKIVATSMLGIYEGLLLGMVMTLVYALPVAIGGTSLAGILVRGHGSPRVAMIPYLEVAMAVSIGWFELVVLVVAAVGDIQLPGIGLQGWVLTLFLLTVPPYVVLAGWPGRDRWRFYSLGLGAVIAIDVLEGDSVILKCVVLGVFVPALVLTIRQWTRPRPIEPASSAPSPAPDHTGTFHG
ncbi:MAG: hypothetical protein C0467_20960 [Planctomycetaceae bacterium]|nr:hypothetical protein [Planctomycetaceae bacterium]